MMLETKRLVLRPWRESDAEDLFRYASHPEVGPACGWSPHKTVEESRQTIRGVLSQPLTLALILKETGRPVGCVGLVQMQGDQPERQSMGRLGYWLGVPYWGRGLVPEAVREVLRWGFEEQGYVTVWCGHFDGNEKSNRVKEKCGFEHRLTLYNQPCGVAGRPVTLHLAGLSVERWKGLQEKSEPLMESPF